MAAVSPHPAHLERMVVLKAGLLTFPNSSGIKKLTLIKILLEKKYGKTDGSM